MRIPEYLEMHINVNIRELTFLLSSKQDGPFSCLKIFTIWNYLSFAFKRIFACTAVHSFEKQKKKSW